MKSFVLREQMSNKSKYRKEKWKWCAPPLSAGGWASDQIFWEILIKNLVTFKKWDGVKGEKF